MFIGAFICDIVPFPFPPAFTVMILLQLMFKLNVWAVIVIGVAGSVLGRYLLTLYIPKLSDSVFKPDKNEDVKYLGPRHALPAACAARCDDHSRGDPALSRKAGCHIARAA